MGQQGTVLIADDDRTIVALLSEFLRKKGFTVTVAFDAMQAMMGLRAEPKVVVVDVAMPGGNGIDILRRIKSSSRTGHMAVIVISASSNPALDDAARKLGADELLRKPIDLRKFHGAVLRALGRDDEAAQVSEQQP